MSPLNKMCELCKDDWQGKRPESTHAYFIGNGKWRGICETHAKEKMKAAIFVTTVEALMKGSEIKWEK